MVIHDAAIFPGVVLTCRIIGILQIKQKSKGKAERNDRLFAIPRRSHSEQGLRDVRDLSKQIQQELEKFFMATDEFEDKKLEIIGWKGPKIAMKAIKDSAKSFSKVSRPAQHQTGNNQAARARRLREPSASFARRPRSNASTAASSGLRLSTPLRSSLSAFDLSSMTRLPSM
jgi:hypothetical protein